MEEKRTQRIIFPAFSSGFEARLRNDSRYDERNRNGSSSQGERATGTRQVQDSSGNSQGQHQASR